MIRNVKVTNHRGETLQLDLRKPNASGYEIRDIQGLEPVKANVFTSSVSTRDGVVINGAQAVNRNVVIRLGLLDFATVEEARQGTYRYFPLKRRVSMIVEAARRTVSLTGVVESNEPTIFSRERETQISIVCEDSWLYDAGPTSLSTTNFYNIEKAFEFPFSNESLTEPLLEFGVITSTLSQELLYNGDVETGVVITVRALGTVKNLVIYNEETLDTIRIDTDKLKAMTGFEIVEGDVITIDTRAGLKGVSLLRNGKVINILNSVVRPTGWITIDKGINRIAYGADSGADRVQLTVQNHTLYEGI